MAQPSAPPPVPPPVQSADEKQAASAPIAFKLRAATPPPTADLPPPSPVAPTPPPVVAAPPVPAPAPSVPPAPPEQATDSSSRLRLRSKENDPAAAAGAAPGSPSGAPEETAASTESAAPKGLKLTAKVPPTLHPHPEGVPPAFLTEVPPAPPPAAAPAVPVSPAPAAVVANSPAPAPGPAPLPEAVPPMEPRMPAPPPEATPPGAKRPPPPFNPAPTTPPAAPKPKVPHFKPTERLNMPAPAVPDAAPAGVKALKVSVLLVFVLIVLLLSAGGYFVWQYLNTPEPPPPAPKQQSAAPAAKPAESGAPTAPAPQPAPGPQQGKADDSIAHIPSKLIGKAQDSISARRSIEQERADNILEGRDLPADRGFPLRATPQAPATAPTDPGTPAAQPASGTGYSNIAPGVVATDSSIRTTGRPSIAFRRIVSDFVIRGVYQGSPSRAHINGRIVTAGNMVDKELQVTFVGVNAEEKMLIFRDATGATVMRRY